MLKSSTLATKDTYKSHYVLNNSTKGGEQSFTGVANTIYQDYLL